MTQQEQTYQLLRDRLIKEGEGFRQEPYMDTMGHKTIGYGFNLDEPRTRQILGQYQSNIPQDVAERLLPQFVNNAEQSAQSYAGPQYSSLSPERQAVLVDMAYNMGGSKLNKFQGMHDAIANNDWNGAADEMMDSNYAHQVKGRAVRNSDLMAGRTMARLKHV